MKMPPTTPRGLFRELERQPNVAMRIARGWIIVGSLIALFAATMVIAHFGFDVPVQNNNSGRPATSGEILFVTLLLMGGGLFFVVAGFALRSWSRSRFDGS
jgi:hypothetical protein